MADGIDHVTASETHYDAVVVGSGVSGSIVAKQLAQQGMHVLVVEAGPGADFASSTYDEYLTRFYGAVDKHSNSPFPANPNAPAPDGSGVRAVAPGRTDATNYLVQTGPVALDSTYSRVVGGTTMHWEGKTLRMLPEDFEMHTRHGVGLDWPIRYEQLQPYYRAAEREIGVSGDVEDQRSLGLDFEPGYVFPMHRMPLSYLDRLIAADLDGTEVELGGETRTLQVRSTPQGRNGVPNAAYDDGRGFHPVGAVSSHPTDEGERCQGNVNCVPLCPVQAKYNARKTLHVAVGTGRVDVLARTVASRVCVGEDGRITHVEYQRYDELGSPRHETGSVRGRIFVLAANPVENARLMLASGLPSSSGLVGRNLMDHAYLLTWALMPQVAGAMRGPLCTAGIEDLRAGGFRRHQAAFRIGIHNDGWGWATGSPSTDLVDLVDREHRFGTSLREALVDRISRQVLLACMVELLPDPANAITVDPAYRDPLGNMRPVLSYRVSDYTMAGVAEARRLTERIYQRIGADDRTHYDPSDPAYVEFGGEGYAIRGGNHWAGTHVMGTDAATSVVDADQRSWDHPNLYLVGPGSMPTIGTANTTLTLAALSFKSSEHMVSTLRSLPAVVREQVA